MTNEPSPRPWSLFVHDEQEGGDGEISICAEGEWIATMNLRRSTAKADAALIVDAVNYYKPELHCDWRELTPEEAIAHCREVAARLGDTPCARDHLQLAAWIEDRDRLRDLVRRLARVAQDTLDFAEAMSGIIPDHPERAKARNEIEALLREARAAIGEDRP